MLLLFFMADSGHRMSCKNSFVRKKIKQKRRPRKNGPRAKEKRERERERKEEKRNNISNNNNNNNNQQQKQQQQKQQLRLKPQPSSSSSSGLPVPDLLESPDTKYDPKAKDIDNDALRLRLKGLIVFYCPFFSLFWVLLSIHYFFCLGRTS